MSALHLYRADGIALAATRRHRSFSLRALSLATGVSYSAIRRFERGGDVSARTYALLMRWKGENSWALPANVEV